eukprot:jgi/Mesvir1/21044/Mv08091-RA.1
MAEKQNGEYAAWASPVTQVVSHFGTHLGKGFTSAQVREQRARYGPNELAKEDKKPLWRLVLEQFDDLLVKILLLAAFLSFILAYIETKEEQEEGRDDGVTEYVEPIVILMILILNAIVGVWQESNAENALEALKDMQSSSARVIRDGKSAIVPASELVPGDLVELVAGDKVPADMRVVELKTATVRVEQASLTGESETVLKGTEPVSAGSDIQGKGCMVFAGTAVVNGACRCVVSSIGMSTEIGKIQSQILEASAMDTTTPLGKQLDRFGENLTKAIGVICLIVWLINYKHFMSWSWGTWDLGGIRVPVPVDIVFNFAKCTYYFKIAVALAVAAIPEGLPTVITTCLALGTRQMAAKNAIVRKLPSVETLGCTTVICSDKTGTLTTNQMSVVALAAPGESLEAPLREFEVQGNTYDPREGGVVGLGGVSSLDKGLQAVARVCCLCNESSIDIKNGVFKAVGQPTEASLMVLVEKLGVPDASENARIVAARQAGEESNTDWLHGAARYWQSQCSRLALLEFDRDRKSMSVLCTPCGGAPTPSAATTATMVTRRRASIGSKDGGNVLYVKGASEAVLERCKRMRLSSGADVDITVGARKRLLAVIEKMSSRGLRCLALAEKHADELGVLADYNGPAHKGHRLLQQMEQYVEIESCLTLVGFAGIVDPPREGVREAVEACHMAGVRVIMITGDNKLTAETISRDVGIIGSDGGQITSLTGKEFSALSHARQVAALSGTGGVVFSRAEPRHKQDIVKVLKEQGHVVAMTGDGVNDAPALKLADIGVAMGITGTEVAKEASDMILADDNFSTIVAAVASGRAIYNNMKAFIRYLISSNIGEVASIFITTALGVPEGLIPVQLLWVNLVTDGPPATALGFNPPDLHLMSKPPRSSKEPLTSLWQLFRYLCVGVYIGAATVGIFVAWYTQTTLAGIDLARDGHAIVSFHDLRTWESSCSAMKVPEGVTLGYTDAMGTKHSYGTSYCDYFEAGKAKASTLSLSVLVAIEMFNALNALSEDGSLLSMPPWANPWLLLAMCVSFGLHCLVLYVPFLASIFGVVPLSGQEWLLVVLFAAPVVLLDEVLKLAKRTWNRMQRPKQKWA